MHNSEGGVKVVLCGVQSISSSRHPIPIAKYTDTRTLTKTVAIGKAALLLMATSSYCRTTWTKKRGRQRRKTTIGLRQGGRKEPSSNSSASTGTTEEGL